MVRTLKGKTSMPQRRVLLVRMEELLVDLQGSVATMLRGQYVSMTTGNLDRRPHTTPVNHRLLLEICRDVSPTGLLPRAPTVPPDGKQERLSCAAFDIRNTDGTTDESNLAPTIAPVVTRKEKQRILHHPPTPKRRDNPTYGATRNNANPNTCGTPSTDSK